MAKSAREEIARLLKGGESTGSFSVETSGPVAGVSLSVEGVGPVKLPVGAAQERKLVSVARPAMFGLGEQTLLDTSVRDTWELTADQVSLGGQWQRVLDAALVEVHEGLGLPRGASLRAELHALLVYGPDQFFAPHQDSEKSDEMVATLVVSLPSVHTGGELVVSHRGQTRTYQHAQRDRISFVAFYADCMHEVLPVRSGRRVTLTFNVLVTHPDEVDIDPDQQLADLVGEHFATPVLNQPFSGPNHLVVLLDHEYSERGLTAGRLKGRDVATVGQLRAAAQRADCSTALALAQIRQVWNVYEDDRSFDYRYDDYDDDEEDYDDEDSYQLGELIEDSISLGWWKRAGVAAGESIRLHVDSDEVCELTPTQELTPYESEYEGFMGNYGNTLDRWYRRAAIVLWPDALDFVARAEADLPQAVAELDARLKGGADLERARADAWDLVGIIGGARTGLLAQVLPVATALDDAELAYGLLAPLKGEGLTPECGGPLAAAAARYGDSWSGRLIDSWFPTGGFHGRDHLAWTSENLPTLAAALRQVGSDSVVTHLCRRLWEILSVSIAAGLLPGPQARAARMVDLVTPAAALFVAADRELAEEFVAGLAAYVDGLLDLELPLLRGLGVAAPPSLAADAVRRLEMQLATAPRADDDWSITWSGCGCDLCGSLRSFLADPAIRALDWPLRTDGRKHVHRQIDTAELPVTHHTIRKGRPYVLRLAKLSDLHEREREQRRQATADLVWLRDLDRR